MVLWCVFYVLYVMYVFLGNYDPIFWYFQFLQNSRKWSPTNPYVKTIKNMKTECRMLPLQINSTMAPKPLEGELFAPGKMVIPRHSSWISCYMLPFNTSLGRSRSLPALGMGSGTASRWVFILFFMWFQCVFHGWWASIQSCFFPNFCWWMWIWCRVLKVMWLGFCLCP